VKVYAGMDPRLPLAQIPAYARRVERLGYDGLHVAETIHDPFMVALLAAEHTSRITIRTSVALAFVRSPTLTAYSAWDLARFSGGRFQLGLGTQIRQNIEDRYGMPWCDPLARIREYVGVLTELFEAFATGSRPEFRGEHYSVTRLQPYFNPGTDPGLAPPTIYLGGVNAGICRLAGELAAGFITHPTNSSPRYLETLCRPQLEVGAERAGRSLTDLELVCGTQVITGATPAELDSERERQRRLFAFLYSTPAYRRTLELYGWDDLAGQLQRMIRADRWDDLAAVVTDEVLDTLLIVAPYAELAAELLGRYDALTDSVLLAPAAEPTHDDQLADVISAVQTG
jgi:probable F420-dependent oxidoreductase